jgi:hypothetical protein
LLLSAAMLVLAQFYGVLGLVQSAMPNGEYTINTAISASSGPWLQGKASVVYASTGWFAGCLAAGMSLLAWGLPSLMVVGGGEEREKSRMGEAREE